MIKKNNLIEKDITNSNSCCKCNILNKLIKNSNAHARAKAKINLCTNADIMNNDINLGRLDKEDESTAAIFEKLMNNVNEIPEGPVFFTNEPTFTCECLFGVCTITKGCNDFEKDAANAIEAAAAYEALIR